MDKFYKALEEKFRGNKKNIKDKLKIYLPILNLIDKNKKIIDIGCGRGEFLELLKENGYKNLTGIDTNKEMLNEIKYKEIQIFTDDGIEFLKKQPFKSAGVISSFHMIEHIEFEKVLTLIKEAFRVLDDNGILILETPNPENLKVASENFYLDYTHIKPIPMELLKFTVEFAGFEARILRLNHQKIGNSIKDIIYGVSPDYAVIGFKNEKMINE
jgi:2-polyprenyl-3-methyl-5-hydroxy-6-metoxy-1,4-benzoquinol methylase